MSKAQENRSAFTFFSTLFTRWTDRDVYGYIHSVSSFSYFDTAIRQFLIEQGALDIHQDRLCCSVVDSGCSYFNPLSFQDTFSIGLRVAYVGNTRIRYELGLFRNGEERSSATACFVHAYSDRRTGEAVTVPEAVRRALEPMVAEMAEHSVA